MAHVGRADKKVDELEKEIQELEAKASGKQPDPEEKEVLPNEPEVKEVEEKSLNTEETTYKKRYGDLRRHQQAKEKEFNDKIAALEEKLKSTTAAVPTTVEDVKKWAEDNPRAAAIIRQMASEEAGERSKKIEEQLKELEEVSGRLEREKEENKIRSVHPDFDDIVDNKSFHDWVGEQPEEFQNLVYDGNSKQVIWAINLYKKENGIKPINTEKEAAKSVSKTTRTSEPSRQPKGRFKESDVQKMSLQEYEKNEEAIMEAMRDGSFVYDLSGGAR